MKNIHLWKTVTNNHVLKILTNVLHLRAIILPITTTNNYYIFYNYLEKILVIKINKVFNYKLEPEILYKLYLHHIISRQNYISRDIYNAF